MRAAVCRRFGEPLVVEELELALPGPGQVAVRIDAVAICQSDVAYAAGAWGGPVPTVLGHEAAGTVTDVGPGVVDLEPGTRVLVTLIRSCGACPACSSGTPTSCDHAFELQASPLRDATGASIAQGMATGAFAEAVVVERSQLVQLPLDVPPEAACQLACGVLTGVGAVVNVAKVPPGATVAVVGAGGVGLNAIQGAALAGAGRVIAIDPLPAKREAARRFGATDAVDPGDGDGAVTAVRAMTHGRGVDFAFVAVGSPSAIEEAALLLAVRGTLVIVGLAPSGSLVRFDPTLMAARNQRVLGARMGQSVIARDVPWLIGAWRAGRLKLEELVTGRFRLDEINDAMAATREGAALRNVIVFRERR
ncbi:Zn-dependent alcohol dehydrogenase [Amaricoccus macauensis]|uniref:Zn-dependent alcohol dehydrogenase n=1 Tax=Amaricoccus macauensis TaxID=57001 RepID=A0A840SPH7_9RHOB|nr:zinc-binding dehydrogenase [Amaricoccus macauensis]MBB5222485.1 Zn-dependent alcohol dehydrogenase [Amaricoccus macauensis]